MTGPCYDTQDVEAMPFPWISRIDLRYPGLRGGIMSPMGISTLMFVCVFGGALCGLLLRATLPKHHLSTDSTDIVNLVLLDRVLASYGPETHEARQLLRRAVAHTLTQVWPEDRAQRKQLAPTT